MDISMHNIEKIEREEDIIESQGRKVYILRLRLKNTRGERNTLTLFSDDKKVYR